MTACGLRAQSCTSARFRRFFASLHVAIGTGIENLNRVRHTGSSDGACRIYCTGLQYSVGGARSSAEMGSQGSRSFVQITLHSMHPVPGPELPGPLPGPIDMRMAQHLLCLTLAQRSIHCMQVLEPSTELRQARKKALFNISLVLEGQEVTYESAHMAVTAECHFQVCPALPVIRALFATALEHNFSECWLRGFWRGSCCGTTFDGTHRIRQTLQTYIDCWPI